MQPQTIIDFATTNTILLIRIIVFFHGTEEGKGNTVYLHCICSSTAQYVTCLSHVQAAYLSLSGLHGFEEIEVVECLGLLNILHPGMLIGETFEEGRRRFFSKDRTDITHGLSSCKEGKGYTILEA